MFQQLGHFVITELQKELHKNGVSWKKWIIDYPMIFDEKDQQYLRSQSQYGYLLFGSLTAIFIYNSTGYIPVFGSYFNKGHVRKRKIVKSIVSPATWDLLENMKEWECQPPDVFAYAPDESDYFFCEAKGPGDKIRPKQEKYFRELERVSGKPVYTVTYKLAPFGKKQPGQVHKMV